MAEDRSAAKVAELGRILVGRALFYEQAKVTDKVRVGKADGLLTLGRGAHAGDDEVDLAVVERVDETREALLDGDGLAAEGLADDLGNLHVVAIGVGSLHVVDGDGVLTGFGNLPVVRGVGRLHADTDLVLADNGIGQVVAAAARRGLNHLERGRRWQPASAPATTVALAASALPKKIRRLHTGWVCAPRCSRGCIWCLPYFVLLTIRQDIRPQPAARHVREKLIDTRGQLAQSSLPPMHRLA